mgnify:CR=1 FL=1
MRVVQQHSGLFAPIQWRIFHENRLPEALQPQALVPEANPGPSRVVRASSKKSRVSRRGGSRAVVARTVCTASAVASTLLACKLLPQAPERDSCQAAATGACTKNFPYSSRSGKLAKEAQVPMCHTPLPNPSLERTANGMAPWPRGAVVHVAPLGQGATPSSAAQLKR